MGTRVFILTLQVTLVGRPLFRRTVHYVQPAPQAAPGAVILHHKQIFLEWTSIPTIVGIRDFEILLTAERQQIVLRHLREGDSDSEEAEDFLPINWRLRHS
jgi:hypothetical protein